MVYVDMTIDDLKSRLSCFRKVLFEKLQRVQGHYDLEDVGIVMVLAVNHSFNIQIFIENAKY